MKKQTKRAGRPEGVKVPCGWGCGKTFTTSEIRYHLVHCAKRPKKAVKA